ncbi:glycosyltransferase family 4 protein [Halomonas organivorans]
MGKRTRQQPTVVTAITSSDSASLIKGQLNYLREHDLVPILVSSPGDSVTKLARGEGVELIEISMKRDPSPLHDLISLFRLVTVFLRLKPDIVNAGTPKAGLLCMLASFICRVPARIYTIRGFRHESMEGRARRLMLFMERISCHLSSHIVCISPSVESLGIKEGLFPPSKCHVNGLGSSNGIDLKRFSPERVDLTQRSELRKSLSIKDNDIVIGFIGRIIARKGVDELVEAFIRLKTLQPACKLVLIGPIESSQPVSDSTLARIHEDNDIHYLGRIEDVVHYYPMMDLFVLPAHWEGFGNVLLEAAAMNIPVVAFDATGTRDAVANGVNGTLVPLMDKKALFNTLLRYVEDAELREHHGRNGRPWASNFRNSLIWEELLRFYQSLIKTPP